MTAPLLSPASSPIFYFLLQKLKWSEKLAGILKAERIGSDRYQQTAHMSQRKSPRLRKGRNSNPSPPSSDHEEEASPPREEEGDDLDELFAHESTVFQEMRSYQTSPHHPHQAHQVTAPSPKKGGRRRSLVVPDDEKTYTPKRSRRITASQITSSGRKRTRKASQTSPTQVNSVLFAPHMRESYF